MGNNCGCGHCHCDDAEETQPEEKTEKINKTEELDNTIQ